MDATVNTHLCFDVDDTNYEFNYLYNPLLMFNGPVCMSHFCSNPTIFLLLFFCFF